MLRNAAWVVSICAGLALIAVPAFAADMQAKKHETMKKHEMHHASRHKMSCYDHAWGSQAQQDCLAKPAAEHRPAHHRAHHHAPVKKPMAKPMTEKKS